MSAAIDNTEDSQAAVYQTNRIASSFTYAFGPVDGLLPGQTYTVSHCQCKIQCPIIYPDQAHLPSLYLQEST